MKSRHLAHSNPQSIADGENWYKQGLKYLLGNENGDINEDNAIACFQRAISLGHKEALHQKAWMHQNGKGGPVNTKAAIALYDKAIALGLPESMNNRAYMHEHC